MMSKEKRGREEQVEYVVMSKLVPENHLLKKVERALDFDFIYKLVQDKYSDTTGRPSIDPVVLIKMAVIQQMCGIRSMRQTVREIEVNAAYRWFLGMGWQDEVPHFSTFGKNYKRRFEGTDLFEQIFTEILQQCYKSGLVQDEVVFGDGTHIKASANKNKKVKVELEKTAKAYAEELTAEIDADRMEHGKKPFTQPEEHKDDEDNTGGGATPPTELVEITQSTTDPESGLFVKGEHERQFAYETQTLCDQRGIVLAYDVVSGNVHDSVSFWGIAEKLKEIHPLYAAFDAAYKTPAICKELWEAGITPVLPYTAPKTKDGFFRKQDFSYIEEWDCFACPEGQMLHYTTTTREGYREYKSCGKQCANCPSLAQCTNSKNHQKVVQRHIWQQHLDNAEAIRNQPNIRAIYKQRKQTIEPVFADGKENHGLRYTQYRGLAKVRMQVGLTFACMNLKKLALWTDRQPSLSPLWALFYNKICYISYLSKRGLPA